MFRRTPLIVLAITFGLSLAALASPPDKTFEKPALAAGLDEVSAGLKGIPQPGRVYLTYISGGPQPFGAYDVSTGNWTYLTSLSTAHQMAVDRYGKLYLLNFGDRRIRVYEPLANTTIPVPGIPPLPFAPAPGNLEVTRDGGFVLTQFNLPNLYYVRPGWPAWKWLLLSFQPNMTGDYDPYAHQLVLNETVWQNCHLIYVDALIQSDTLVVTSFSSGVPQGGPQRFGAVVDGHWYSQFGINPVRVTDLSDWDPLFADFAPLGSYLPPMNTASSAADRLGRVIYAANIAGPLYFGRLDLDTATWQGLASPGFVRPMSTLAFVPDDPDGDLDVISGFTGPD